MGLIPANCYRPDIDGLRALAVLAVVLFHAELGAGGGYVGVDVFFVISGYLITGLFLRDSAAGNFSLLHFWERRIRRIMPPLVVVVMATVFVGWWLLLAEDYKELGQSVVAQVLLLSNVFFWRESGYFEQSSDLKPLLHTWSLAVEEQFYSIFPLVMSPLMTRSRRVTCTILVLTLIGSLGLSVYWSQSRPDAGFYLLPARVWELLLGALLAIMPSAFCLSRRWQTEVVGMSGMIMILWAVIAYDTETCFPGVAALMPCVGAALLIGCGTKSFAGRILACPLLVAVGLVSYSLYLWHWPLLVFSSYWASVPLTVLERILLLAASGVLAFLSWRFVERPFRKGAVCGTRRSIYVMAIGSSTALILLGLGLNHAQGVPSRIPAAAQHYADGKFDSPYRKEVSLDKAQRGEFISVGVLHQEPAVGVLVWGDSHAMALLPVINDLCQEKGIRGVAAVHYQTPPLVNYRSRGDYSLKEDTPAFSSAVVDFIREKKVPSVILTAAWNFHFSEGGRGRIKQALKETMVQLKATGAKVWVMQDVPNHSFDVPRRLASAVLFGENVDTLSLSLDNHRIASAMQNEVLKDLSPNNFKLLDPAGVFFTASGHSRIAADGNALYTDSNHISAHGARLLRPLLAPVFD